MTIIKRGPDPPERGPRASHASRRRHPGCHPESRLRNLTEERAISNKKLDAFRPAFHEGHELFSIAVLPNSDSRSVIITDRDIRRNVSLVSGTLDIRANS